MSLLARKPLLVIVGRPNVGKSTLFNGLTGRRKALVFDEAGVTRNLHSGRTLISGYEVDVVDTGGILPGRKGLGELDCAIQKQVEEIIQRADMILVVFDARMGPLSEDRELTQRLRKVSTGKQILYVANKVDTEQHSSLLLPFYDLGIQEVLPLSAEHKLGLEEIRERLGSFLQQKFLPNALPVETKRSEKEIQLAIIGRPNVGKSTLMNALLGEERSLVSSVAGTTRDGVRGVIREGKNSYVFVDTAGIRRRGKTKGLEGVVAIKAIQSLEQSYLAVLVLDLEEGVTDQDCRIAALAHQNGRGLLIFGNKLDLVRKKNPRLSRGKLEGLVEKEIRERMPFLEYAPIVLGSALQVRFARKDLFSFLAKMERARRVEIPTAELNQYVQDVLKKRPLPIRSGKKLKVFYMTQAVAHHEQRGIRPSTPEFICFVNSPESVEESDQRFLINSLRKRYPFFGNPIFLRFRTAHGSVAKGRDHN